MRFGILVLKYIIILKFKTILTVQFILKSFMFSVLMFSDMLHILSNLDVCQSFLSA